MGDIYDDIDEILSAADAIEAETSAVMTEEKNFNEDELQDIMSEIESLEKEFGESEDGPVAISVKDAVMEELNEDLGEITDEDLEEINAEFKAEVAEVIAKVAFADSPTKPSLQDEIEKELEASLKHTVAEANTKTEPKAEVLKFETPKSKTISPAPQATGDVSFSAVGSMALTLDFKIGEENAKLIIDPVKGLLVTLAGVELKINETDGCHVTMENGMKFSIPLATLDKSAKKAA